MPHCILVAEDNRVQAKRIVHYLEEFGYQAHAVENGRLALQALDQFDPDLIISDIQMPEMDGYEFLSELRKKANFIHTPVLVMTSVSEKDSLLKALELGATEFLQKPFSPTELKIRVKNLVDLSLAQRDLRDQNREIKEKASRASRLATVGLLGAGVAHEINNPLTIILGFTERLEKGVSGGVPLDPAKSLGYFEKIKGNIYRISRIVDLLKRISKSTGGNEKVVNREMDLRAFLIDLQELYVQKLRNYDIDFTPNYGEFPVPVMMNEAALGQAVLSVITNAIDATNAQEERIISITLNSDLGSGFAEIWIDDNGPGISEANREHIFDPFFSTKGPGGGMGLGLSLAHTYLLEQGGQIEIGQVARGSRLILRLKLAKAVESAA